MFKIDARLEKEIDVFWSAVVLDQGESSPYLDNLKMHINQLCRAEIGKTGGADEWAISNGNSDAQEMLWCVLNQSQEDWKEKSLEWVRK